MPYVKMYSGYRIEYSANESFAEAKPISSDLSCADLMAEMERYGYRYHHTTSTGSIIFEDHRFFCSGGDM